MNFRTQFDPNYEPTTGEINNKPSMTVPDQNLSIRQLLINHSRGVPSGENMREGVYTDMEVPNFKDLNDVKEYAESLEARKADIEARIQEEEQARQDEEAALLDDNDSRSEPNNLETSI